MSDLLKKAIVDATALKEAALKNAEKAIVEKYSSKIKEAVESILEQDDLAGLGLDDEEGDLGGDADLSIDVGGDSDTGGMSDVGADVPLAATDGMQLCPCQDEEEEFEIDFDELQKQMAMPGAEEAGAVDREAFADDTTEDTEPSIEDDLEMAKEEQDLMETEEEKECLDESCLDEDLELDEEELRKLAEELAVDLDVVPNGVQGANRAEKKEAQDIALAKENETIEEDEEEVEDETKKQLDELKDKLEKIEENRKKSHARYNKLLSENKKLKSFLLKFRDKLGEVQLMNAKLLYKNRVLDSSSLNERQKVKIAEAISNAKTVDSVKVIFEAVTNAVGSDVKRTALPKSLHEAVSRSNSSTMRAFSEERKEVTIDPVTSKWKKLAGIK